MILSPVKEPRRVPALVFSAEGVTTLPRPKLPEQLDHLLLLEVLRPSKRGGSTVEQVLSGLDTATEYFVDQRLL